jgi:signal transduction histidine kinase
MTITQTTAAQLPEPPAQAKAPPGAGSASSANSANSASSASSAAGAEPSDARFNDSPAYFLSVGTKGLLVFVALLVYLVGISLFAMHQKKLLQHDFDRMQTAIEDETVLSQAHVSIFHAIGALTINFNETDIDAGLRRIAMHQQLFQTRQAEVTERFPAMPSNAAEVTAAFARVSLEPSQAHLKLLISELLQSESDLERAIGEVRERRQALSDNFRARSNAAALTVLLLSSLGLLLLGTAVGLFFRRLVEDLRVLQRVTLATVRGLRGKPLVVKRHDEVGQLMVAVNSMAATLDQSARELMLERQKYFHKEKMAAIGTLAAGIAHEIGNPIAAISGVAQEMMERRAQGQPACQLQGCSACHPELIFAQATRLANITREISMFAAPCTTESQLIDLNAILRSTASLIRYDKRLVRIALDLELDSQLPAIQGVADQMTQLTMNLLINAMDALQAIEGRTPAILIQTGSDAQKVWLFVNDNGCGMTAQTLGRAFEAFFTTKPVGKGTGLGLSLCYSIVKAHGGTIEIQSTPGLGTQVQVCFPLGEYLVKPLFPA